MSSYRYSQVVRNLMHAIINSRLDCAFNISSLAQYMSNPSISHWQGIKRVLRYIKGTINMGIQYQCHGDGHILHGFADVN